MAPTEPTILHNYLLVPAQLPTIISLDEFKALFPPQHRSSPQVRALYRDLQRQRNSFVDSVQENIESEAAQDSRVIRRNLGQADRAGAATEVDPEDEIEKVMLGSDTKKVVPPSQTLARVLASVESSSSAMNTQIKDLEAKEAQLLQSIQETVGHLSDLRYGRLGNSSLPEQVLDGLNNLEATCKKMT